jgi:hypothetical protein
MDPQQSQQHRLCSLYIEGLERESLRSQPYFARSCYATVLMIPWLAMPMLLEILYAWEEENQLEAEKRALEANLEADF